MAKTKPPWHACLPAAEAAPCGYELKRIGCGWWYQSRDEDEECCHERIGRPGRKPGRQLWLEAKAKAEAEAKEAEE